MVKFEITMKDPDGFYESVADAARGYVTTVGRELSPDEKDVISESRREELKELLEKWFEYDEYVTLIVDTDDMTCVVKERK